MATSNHERVGKALDLLRAGIKPYVEREMRAAHGKEWLERAEQGFPQGLAHDRGGEINWDTHALLSVMSNNWNSVFGKKLGKAERNLVEELRSTRNDWAHQKAFTSDDAYRALDSVYRLLAAISAEQAHEVEHMKQELLRVRFDEQARSEARRASTAPTEGQPATGLKPWREVITPHPDVASGKFQQAEFAADLGQVHRGEGSSEYRDPRDFFGRTFITHGLERLMVVALQRLTDAGGDPVVELQTNFGGGKTHSMLALYHLFSGTATGEMAGVDVVLRAAGVSQVPKSRRAVLVGTDLNPAQPHEKADGTRTNTLWGELAWQLLGKDGYKLVAEADRKGVSPGAATLRELFKRAAPCIVLIDEWVAYARNLYGVSNLPAGSFDANMTFAQALTEAAKGTPRAMVVASIPASDAEIGGEGGVAALERIRNVFARIDSPWTPASTEEGFEIVRRRLFQPITEKELYGARDAVAKKFGELYQQNAQDFPRGCREGEYERRIQKAYPIHPELFDRLFEDWSALETFQRTRGVLRLMAAVIHTLWKRNDANLLIMPGNVPVDEPAVQFELMRYLDDPWRAVIEADVDGPTSLPLKLDQENPTLGRYSACRRVARTVFVGSAPKLAAANKGIDDQQVRLGCVQPGESVATFGDSLRRLSNQATYLYQDGRRYWYSTQQSVVETARSRAENQTDDAVAQEVLRRVKDDARERGDFPAVHVAADSADIEDESRVRLVIFGPEHHHTGKSADSPARKRADEILNNRGNSPRALKNTLVFLAPDRARLEDLKRAARDYLAWASVLRDKEELNLDVFQSRQAETKHGEADSAVKHRIPEAYAWLLVPGQQKAADGPPTGVEWTERRLSGQEPLASRASKKLRSEDLLLTSWAGSLLKRELDRIPLWQGNHIELKQLAVYFARYLYLPRLRDANVLLEAVRDGLNLTSWTQDSFAYADAWDESKQRYVGLKVGKLVNVSLEGGRLLVRSEVAKAQIDAEAKLEEARSEIPSAATGDGQGGEASAVGAEREPEHLLRRFHGSIALDPVRLTKGAVQIADEVVQHLTKLAGANVEVVIEIQAEIPSGAPDDVVRTVTENCRTLKFRIFGFEEK
jgi:predicted AAA+ superfamily ATPase